MKYIAIYDSTCGIGESPDAAFSDLKENSTRDPEIEEVLFYTAKEIKVKQTIIIVDDEKSDNT